MKCTKIILENLYLIERKSPEEIAKTFGVSGRTIRNWMVKFGISRLGPTHLRKGKSATWNIGREKTSAEIRKNREWHIGKVPYNLGVGDKVFNCAVCKIKVTDKPYRKKVVCSEKCRNKYNTLHRGQKHWNYKGEKAGFRQRSRGWAEYKEWRKNVLGRDKNICQFCLENSQKMTAHHICTFNDHQDIRYDISNGVCLCKKCHWSFHRKYGHHHTNREMLIDWFSTRSK